MKNKIVMLMIASLFLVLSMNFILGEVYLWNSVNLDQTNDIVDYHGYIQFEDTTAQMSGANTPININLYYTIQALPLVLNGSYGSVDWCNLTIQDEQNTFDNLGNILNVTDVISSYYFGTGAVNSSVLSFSAKNKDSLIADLRCHYTDSRGLYYANILAGSFTTYMSSYECATCRDYSLEQLSDMSAKNENITTNELLIYDNIQKVADYNYQIWSIASWLFKIILVIGSVGLIFAGVYYFYIFFSNLGKELN